LHVLDASLLDFLTKFDPPLLFPRPPLCFSLSFDTESIVIGTRHQRDFFFEDAIVSLSDFRVCTPGEGELLVPQYVLCCVPTPFPLVLIVKTIPLCLTYFAGFVTKLPTIFFLLLSM